MIVESIGTLLVVAMLTLIALAVGKLAVIIGALIDEIVPLRILVVPACWYLMCGVILLMCGLSGMEIRHAVNFIEHPWQLALVPIVLFCPVIKRAEFTLPAFTVLVSTFVIYLAI
jgi:hypothetical protein